MVTIIFCVLIIIVIVALMFTLDGILDWIIDHVPSRYNDDDDMDGVPVIPYGEHHDDNGADARLVRSVEEYVERLRRSNPSAYTGTVDEGGDNGEH